MLRNFVILGIFIGALAVTPALYESNAGVSRSILAAGSDNSDDTKAAPRDADAKPARPEVKALVGKKARLAADRHGHFLAEFKLNGRSVEALVDTGATAVAINRTTARRVGILLDRADFRYQVNTANGQARAAAVKLESIQIGRIHVRDVPAVVLEDEALDGTLIGMSFLSRLGKFQVEDGSLLLQQ
jgi:aspartyl protease family protein